MPERGVSDGQPSVTVAEITDPAIAGQGIELIDLDALQLTSGPFRARRVVVRLEGGAVVYHSTNHRIRTRTTVQGGRLAYAAFDARAKGTVNGLAIHPDLVVAIEPETEIAVVTDAGYECILLLLPPADIRAHLRDRRREGDFRIPNGAEMLQADAAKVRRLFAWGNRLVDTAARQPALFNDRKDERAAHRGAGPRGTVERRWDSFDKYLLDKAASRGARIISGRGDEIALHDGYPHIGLKRQQPQRYDLLAVAIGVNTGTLKLIEQLPIDYQPPKTTGTYICEFYLGAETIDQYLGSSMHVFLLNLPRLEFAARIPKGDFASFCLLGHNVDDELIHAFLDSPEVKNVLPPGWTRPEGYCHCSPRMILKPDGWVAQLEAKGYVVEDP